MKTNVELFTLYLESKLVNNFQSFPCNRNEIRKIKKKFLAKNFNTHTILINCDRFSKKLIKNIFFPISLFKKLKLYDV